MRGADELKGLDAEAIVRGAIDDPGSLKPAYLELSERPASNEAAGVLVEAWTAGHAPAWLVAALLGACRSPIGGPTCLAILEGGHGTHSEGYAGVGLARIRGTDARADLRRVVLAGRTLAIREGALAGLMHVGVGDERVPFLASLAEGRRVRAETIGSHLARDPMRDEDALQWLTKGETWHRHVILGQTIDGARTGTSPSRVLAAALLKAMDDGRLYENASNRALLTRLFR